MGKRVYLMVMDSFGIGALPDAANFGDGDVNTLRSVASVEFFHLPMLQLLGLFNIDGVTVSKKTPIPVGAFGRLAEKSLGKDTTTGHWEIAGLVSERAMPTFPNGFPSELIEAVEKELGVKTICNKPYSGTEVIRDYGREQKETGALIAYTSADSVYQIAAHEDIFPVETLYDYCKRARKILQGEWGVGRVIARPYVGDYPDYERTPRRHDYSLNPPKKTLLDVLTEAKLTTIGVGKISDIFAGRGISRHIAMSDNSEGMARTHETLNEDFTGLCFTNLVDFDMKYGHRRDIEGYYKALQKFDGELASFIADMKNDDILIITADHGCDPGAPGSDHTREYVPVLVCGKAVKESVNLGTRASFADIAATIEEYFSLEQATEGESFWQKITR